MDPLHCKLFNETKAANTADFAEMHRLIAECDRAELAILLIIQKHDIN
jgi:hypothetical protein